MSHGPFVLYYFYLINVIHKFFSFHLAKVAPGKTLPSHISAVFLSRHQLSLIVTEKKKKD